MARTPTLWQRKEDRFYHTAIRGKQIKLSKEKKEARRLFLDLMPSALRLRPATRRQSPPGFTIWEATHAWDGCARAVERREVYPLCPAGGWLYPCLAGTADRPLFVRRIRTPIHV